MDLTKTECLPNLAEIVEYIYIYIIHILVDNNV